MTFEIFFENHNWTPKIRAIISNNKILKLVKKGYKTSSVRIRYMFLYQYRKSTLKLNNFAPHTKKKFYALMDNNLKPEINPFSNKNNKNKKYIKFLA
jgi:hypothetical protein